MRALDAFGPRTWADPGAVSLGRLPMRSPLVAHPTPDAARGDRESSPWWQSLNGRWRFRLRDRPTDVALGDVTGPTTTAEGWSSLHVPGHWTMQGFDRPQYTNVQMPFPGRPPELPDANPTGVYRTTFRIPADWRRRTTVLHIGAAESVVYVFVNGQPVGFSTDSRMSAELDITDSLVAGVNELALVVVKWSAQSYVEDQDCWWMGGLPREVLLRSVAPVHIADVHIDAGLVDAGLAGANSGTLRVRTTVGFSAEALALAQRDRHREGGTHQVIARLETLDGSPVGDELPG